MPIYEYRCEACDHRLEKLMKLSDEPPVICPKCSQPALQKMVSAAAFRLKGSGWYETDFKTGSKKNVLHGVGGAESSGGGSDSGTAKSATPEVGSSGSASTEKSSSSAKSSETSGASSSKPASS